MKDDQYRSPLRNPCRDDHESDRMLILSLKRDIDMLRQQVEALTRHLGVTAPRSGTHLPYR